jgi:hypothetical protein
MHRLHRTLLCPGQRPPHPRSELLGEAMIDTDAMTTADDLTAVSELAQAERRVELARRRLQQARRGYLRRTHGATDVHNAEHALAQALEEFDQARDPVDVREWP